MSNPLFAKDVVRSASFILTILALGLFYAGISYHAHQSLTARNNGGWYGELAKAFSQGKVSLLSKPSEGLLADPNPYGSIHNYKYKWDVSFYNKKYYLYFGPVPAVLFFLPWQLFTGTPLNQALLFWLLCMLQLVVFALFIEAAVRLHFKATPLWLRLLLLGMFGLCGTQGFCIHFVLAYSISTTAGATFILCALYFLFLAIHSQNSRCLFLSMASACWGLAVGSRPTLIVYGLPLILFLFLSRNESSQTFIRSVCAATLPAMFIGVLLAIYNYVRFGSPTNFGVEYQLSGVGYSNEARFSLLYFPINFLDMLFMPPRPRPEFPFLFPHPPMHTIFSRRLSGSYSGLAFILPTAGYCFFWKRALKDRRVRIFALLCTVGAACSFFVLTCYFAVLYRYYVDFLIPIFLVMSLCVMGLGNDLFLNRVYSTFFCCSIALSIYCGLAFSLVGEINGIHTFNTYPPPPQGQLWLPDSEERDHPQD